MNKKYKDYDWLKQQYNNGKTSVEIAAIFGVGSDTITYHLRKIGIRQKRVARIVGDKKKCDECCGLLPLSNFKKRGGKHSYDGYLHICKKCYNSRNLETTRKYNSRPDVRRKMKAAGRKYLNNNREKLNVKRRERWQLIKNNTNVRINNTMSSRINRVLRGSKSKMKWIDLVGYTTDNLRLHIESLWEPWMSWENWGVYDEGHKTWHIDHIRPIASFNITSFDCGDLKECWSLKNLRPLLAIDNHRKGAKYTGVTMSNEKKVEKTVKYELKISRMDPFQTYSASAVALQLAEALENAMNFQADADAYYEQAKNERIKAKKLQLLIKRLNERDKKRAAEAVLIEEK